MRRTALLAILILLSAGGALLPACGYHLSGTGSLLPAGTGTIAIPAFINDTNEPSVDVQTTRAVTAEFIADGRLRVEDVERADVVLRGRVVRYEVTALSYTADSYVQQYRVRIVVDANLKDQKSGKVLWKESGIESVFIADYRVVIGDIQATKIAKEQAITKASQDIAWTIRSRVLEGF